MFVRGAVPGPEIASVVRIDAVCNCVNVPRPRECVHLVEQFVLTVVTTIGVICDVKRILEFRSLDEFVTNSRQGNESFYLLAVVFGKARRQRGNRNSTITQDMVRGPGKIRRVGSSRQRDQNR